MSQLYKNYIPQWFPSFWFLALKPPRIIIRERTMTPSLKFKPVVSGWLQLLLLLFSGLSQCSPTVPGSVAPVSEPKHHKVLILGGGVAGVIAARTLHRNGIDDFVIVEARHELGGRMMSHSFGGKTIELGANWIQGTQTGNGPANPIYELAKKHNIKSQSNEFGSVST